MSVDEFLQKLTEALEASDPLQPGQALAEVDTWDSLGILAAVSLYEEIGIKIELDRLSEAKTTDDLVKLASAAIGG